MSVVEACEHEPLPRRPWKAPSRATLSFPYSLWLNLSRRLSLPPAFLKYCIFDKSASFRRRNGFDIRSRCMGQVFDLAPSISSDHEPVLLIRVRFDALYCAFHSRRCRFGAVAEQIQCCFRLWTIITFMGLLINLLEL
jgi:hypothetical protein